MKEIKYKCDCCGKEGKTNEVTHYSRQLKDTYWYKHFDLCNTCLNNYNKIISKQEKEYIELVRRHDKEIRELTKEY